MGDSALLRTSMKCVLFLMCALAQVSTLAQLLILYSLYIRHDSSIFYAHLSVSLLAPFLVFIYLLYGVRVSGDRTNPLLPCIIMWIDLRSYFVSDFELGHNSLYSFLNSYHSGCCTFISSVATLLFIIPSVALCSPFVVILILTSWSAYVSCIKPAASRDCDLLLLQFPFMVPCFYLYSVMLFVLPIHSDSNLILLMIIFWISSISYLSLYVTCFSIEKHLSDLVLLTELLLLFTVLYIALLIDYDAYPYLHTVALIMLICSAITDGFFLKSAPVREYVHLSNRFKSELYSFKANDADSLVVVDKLYCLIHDIIYHQDPLENDHTIFRLQNQGYEHVKRMKEPHVIHSNECYKIQHQFMRKSDERKQQHIHDLLDHNISVIRKRSKVSHFRPCALMFVYLYWLLSFVVAVYPFVWLFYSVFIADPALIRVHYRDIFVVFIVLLYGAIMTHTCGKLYAHYDKFVLIRKLKQIPLRGADSDEKQELEEMYKKMLIAEELIQRIEVEAACIVLSYVYGETEKVGAHQKRMCSSDDDVDSLYGSYDAYESGGDDMENLL